MSILAGVPIPYRWEPNRQNDVTPRAMSFAAWLAAVPGDAIITVAATVVPAVSGGLTVLQTLLSGAIVTVWLGGGVENQNYVVILTVVTQGGRTENFPIQIAVPAVGTIL